MQEIIAGLAQYDTATVFNATEVRAMRAGLECFKREGLGRTIAAAEVAWGEGSHKDI